jgi:hypothetical protein
MIHRFSRVNPKNNEYDEMTAIQITPLCGVRRIFVMAVQGNPLGCALRSNEEPAELRGVGVASREPYVDRALQTPGSELPVLLRAHGLEAQRSTDGETFRVQPLQGLIVRDASGQFYESLGQRLRPLQRVARGPNGELLELLPVREDPCPSLQEEQFAGFRLQGEGNLQMNAGTQAKAYAPQTTGVGEPTRQGSVPAFRRLFVEPGIPRIVTLGDFRAMLVPQLACAERLRDAHRLKCFVRVYEATRKLAVADFVKAVQSSDPCSAPLQSLNDTYVAELEIANVLPRRRISGPTRREPGMVVPYDRFFCLVIETDPTSDRNCRIESPRSPEPQADATQSNSGGPLSLRTSVPEVHGKPWEFVFARDEVLYDMNRAVLTQTILKRFWRWLKNRFTGAQELQKWQSMLQGKSLDEQLWAVRPPRSAFERRAIREWAARTLSLAGYDAQEMLLEWEVFWRRKGV